MEQSEIDLLADRTAQSFQIGYVYLLRRHENSDVCKVGFTSTAPKSRAGDYTDGEWIVYTEYKMPLWLAKLVERRTHQNLKAYWLDPRITGGTATEVFTCNIETADLAIKIAHLEIIKESFQSLNVPKLMIDELICLNSLDASDSSSLKRNLIIDELENVKKENRLLGVELLDCKALIQDTYRQIEKKDREIAEERRIRFDENAALFDRLQQVEKELSRITSLYQALRQLFGNYRDQMTWIKSIEKSEQAEFCDDDLKDVIARLIRFSDRKINLSDFEDLRDHYRDAVEILRNLS